MPTKLEPLPLPDRQYDTLHKMIYEGYELGLGGWNRKYQGRLQHGGFGSHGMLLAADFRLVNSLLAKKLIEGQTEGRERRVRRVNYFTTYKPTPLGFKSLETEINKRDQAGGRRTVRVPPKTWAAVRKIIQETNADNEKRATTAAINKLTDGVIKRNRKSGN